MSEQVRKFKARERVTHPCFYSIMRVIGYVDHTDFVVIDADHQTDINYASVVKESDLTSMFTIGESIWIMGEVERIDERGVQIDVPYMLFAEKTKGMFSFDLNYRRGNEND